MIAIDVEDVTAEQAGASPLLSGSVALEVAFNYCGSTPDGPVSDMRRPRCRTVTKAAKLVILLTWMLSSWSRIGMDTPLT